MCIDSRVVIISAICFKICMLRRQYQYWLGSAPACYPIVYNQNQNFSNLIKYPRLLVYQIFCCIGNYLLWKFSLWSLRTPHKSLLPTFFCKLFLHSLVFSKYFPNKTNFINRPLYIPPSFANTSPPLNNPIHQNMRGPNCLGISDILPPLWISDVFIILILMILSDFLQKMWDDKMLLLWNK